MNITFKAKTTTVSGSDIQTLELKPKVDHSEHAGHSSAQIARQIHCAGQEPPSRWRVPDHRHDVVQREPPAVRIDDLRSRLRR